MLCTRQRQANVTTIGMSSLLCIVGSSSLKAFGREGMHYKICLIACPLDNHHTTCNASFITSPYNRSYLQTQD